MFRTATYSLHGLVPASCLCADRYDREAVVRALGAEAGLKPPLILGQLPSTPDELLKIDQVFIKSELKVGVVFAKAGQTTEEAILGNRSHSLLFDEFLGLLGDRIKLRDANSATSFDFAIDTPFNGAIKAQRGWPDSSKDVNPASEDGFTVVQGKKRRRGSAESPVTAAHSSNARRSGSNRRQRSSTERVPRAQEIKTTRTHIVEARARQASSTEEQCLYVEHCPEFEPYHYLKAIDEMVGGTSDVVQVTKMNGHCLLGLANKALAERLINEGLEVEGMLLRTFPFYRRAAKITIGNLPFFVKDVSVIDALLPYGRVTSIVPKQLKAGKYVYTDGRREAFIVPHDGINIESIPARLDIRIKGEAWPMYLTFGISEARSRSRAPGEPLDVF
ncbi:hypothetical protein LAZ67_20000888 [Cordylochernes scorpioides]|uniref:Uncharacterized protein n=1 Tax=Cordylochernes scorpioides TaxID=51811 RepID=A0ABY6LNQ4_9ARAC|nr:hypothetical protein LAZ67_20000888 [Cordylochernes scorpioides]